MTTANPTTRTTPPTPADPSTPTDPSATSTTATAAATVKRWLQLGVEDERSRRAFNLVAAALVFYWVLQRFEPSPFGVLVKGAVIGGLYSLIALGIALVYRANRIVNFAQGDLGGVPGSLAVLLIAVSGWPYPLAILAGLATGVLLGVVVEVGLIRRFTKAPRLVLTVVTIGIAQVLTFIEIGMPRVFHATVPPQSFPSPFNQHFGIGPVTFYGNDILAMAAVPVVLVALAWFLNRTHTGVAIRACAESADRASLLGVPVKRINLVVWAVAALLATVGVLLRAGVVGLPIGSALGLSVLLRTLAAAVIGRMEKMPTIVIAAVLLGVIEQAVVWHTGSTDSVDLIIFIVIIGALLAQRRQLGSRLADAAISTWNAMREVRPVPPELASLPQVTWARRGVVTVLAALVVAAPMFISEAKIDLGIFLAAYLIIALSLLVLSGWAGQISLGQFAFVATGASVGAWMILHWHMDILLVLVAAGAVGALVAVAVGIPALRIKGLFLAVATLAFSFAANSYFLNATRFTWIPDQFTVVPRLPLFGKLSIDSADRYYYFCWAVLLFCILAVRGMRASRIGRVLVASRENERGVQAYGVNVTRAKLVAFATSGFLAAMAGVLIMGGQQALYPGGADPQSSMDAFLMVVIGGMGSMTGVFAGAVYLEALSWLRPDVPHSFQNILTAMGSGIGLIVILMFLPSGIGSLIFQARDRLLRELAARKGIVVPSLVADLAQARPADSPDDSTREMPVLAAPIAAAAGGAGAAEAEKVAKPRKVTKVGGK
ncbi:MAG TPA: ABC transporter permease [Acidimicrobiales bacterium]|nr:ABC transporter permease [Acidimicrobiales bacterium]